jgi:hypothetical protein
MQEIFLEHQRHHSRHPACQDAGLSTGCVLLQRPWHNLVWCYQNRTWPTAWSFLWLAWLCLFIPLHWSPVVNALMYVEDEHGELLFHSTKGLSRMTEPRFFPPGFFETCWVLRPVPGAARKKLDAALLEACLGLVAVSTYSLALPRIYTKRIHGKPMPVEQFRVSECKVTGIGFLLACAWKRATFSVRSSSLSVDPCPLLDIGLVLRRHPCALLPRDLCALGSCSSFRLDCRRRQD